MGDQDQNWGESQVDETQFSQRYFQHTSSLPATQKPLLPATGEDLNALLRSKLDSQSKVNKAAISKFNFNVSHTKQPKGG